MPASFHKRVNSINQPLATVEVLKSLSVKLDKRIDHAVKTFELVNSREPRKPASADIVAMYLADGTTPDDVQSIAAKIAAHQVTMSAWSEAQAQASHGVQSALKASIDSIVEALRSRAEDSISALTWYVSEGQPDLAELLRNGRTKDAEKAANILEAWGTLSHLLEVRDAALGSPRFNWSMWKNPTLVRTLKIDPNQQPIDRVMGAMEQGGELTWSTYPQAQESQEAVRAAAQVEADSEHLKVTVQKQSAY